MRDLLTNPMWQASDLGLPIPDSAHAVSVALPLWDHVIGYEEKRADVVDRMQCGYPRFFCSPLMRRLFSDAKERFAGPGQACVVFPSPPSAERCAAYVERRSGSAGSVHPVGRGMLHALVIDADGFDAAMDYWRLSGEIVSSRQAEWALGSAAEPPGYAASDPVATLRSRLADITGQNPDDVYLFPTGMNAVFTVCRMLQSVFPGNKCVQIDFPYVDVLKVQEQFGPGVHFLAGERIDPAGTFSSLADAEPLSGVFCELASNPLLRSADVDSIHGIARAHDIPIVVDDTIASSVNIDAFRVADVVTTSLTKYFSGASDVMGGSVILRADSSFHEQFSAFLKGEVRDDGMLWHRDAEALELNSRDYPDRMRRINQNGRIVAEYFDAAPGVDHVYYPGFEDVDNYHQLLRPGGGYGGLLSLGLRGEADNAPRFYDNLRVSKGPSLGTNFTLACPYTLLAHYDELEWAESYGCSRYLVRIGIGLEEPDDLIRRFEAALESLA